MCTNISTKTKPPPLNIAWKTEGDFVEKEVRITINCKKCGTPWERMGVKCPAPGCGSKSFNKIVKAVPIPLASPEFD
jgi:hypothetical protein